MSSDCGPIKGRLHRGKLSLKREGIPGWENNIHEDVEARIRNLNRGVVRDGLKRRFQNTA